MAEPLALIDQAQVNTPHPDYVSMLPDLEMVDDLRQGTRRLRERHDAYLPKFAEESNPNYERRWKQATLYNAFEETIGTLVGKAFSKPPILDAEDVPIEIAGDETIDGIAENIDRSGNSFLVFSQAAFREGLRSGLVHILVDMPPMPTTEEGRPVITTQAEAQEAPIERRPYWVMVKAKDVIGWRSTNMGGQDVLSQVRIQEEVEEDDGEFGVKEICQIRVINIGSWEIYRAVDDKGDSWRLVEQGEMRGADGNLLTYIPLATFYSDESNEFMTAIPPLLDLGYKNLEHFQVHSDYRNCMTVACFPVFCLSGYQGEEDKISLGPTTTIKLTDPASKAYFAEHSGQALGAARTYLEDLKEEMAMYGLRMLLPRTGGSPTATGEAITEARSTTSQLQVAALRFKDCLENALNYTAKWMGLESGGSVKMDVSNLVLSTQDIDQILKAAGAPQKPVLSVAAAIRELIRRGFLPDDTDPQEIMAELSNQAQMGALSGLAGQFLRPAQAAAGPAAPAGTPPPSPV